MTEVRDKQNTDQAVYSVNGKCLAFHGPLLYEAKILQIWDPEQGKIQGGQDSTKPDARSEEENEMYPPKNFQQKKCYFIHYQGWKSTWDEWIGEERIRVYNDENIELKKRLAQEARDSKKLKQQENKKRKVNPNTDLNSTSENNSSKRKSSYSSEGDEKSLTKKKGLINQSGIEKGDNERKVKNEQRSKSEETSTSVSSLNSMDQNPFGVSQSKLIMHVPVKIKAKLVDDWELVTKDKKICTLPCKVTITKLINTYKKQTTKHMSLAEQCQLNEFVSGLIVYFEDALPRLLLYRLERLQYEQIFKDSTKQDKILSSCEIYGPLHLLRLIVILPELMVGATMDLQSCQLIIKQSERLLIWMTIHIDTFFPTLSPREEVDTLLQNDQGYDNTSSQYEGVALGL